MEARLVTSTNISDPFSLWIQNPTCGNFSLRSICKTWGPLRGGWARDACGLGSWDTLRGSRSRLRITWQDTWSDGWQTPEPPYLMEQWTMGTRQRGLYCSGASWCLRGERAVEEKWGGNCTESEGSLWKVVPITGYIPFFFFLALPCILWDFSCLTRHRTNPSPQQWEWGSPNQWTTGDIPRTLQIKQTWF